MKIESEAEEEGKKLYEKRKSQNKITPSYELLKNKNKIQ
jgi:hypothetical protein